MYRDLEKRKQYLKIYNDNRSEENKIRCKDRYKEISDFINKDKLKKGCSECGYNKHPHALHFDHIDRTKKYKAVSQLKASSNLENVIIEII